MVCEEEERMIKESEDFWKRIKDVPTCDFYAAYHNELRKRDKKMERWDNISYYKGQNYAVDGYILRLCWESS